MASQGIKMIDGKSGHKHILCVTQYYYPEPFRINDMTAEWVKRGHKVTVLTGIPNYPEGRFYKGYGLFKKRRETHDGVKIIRVPIVSRGHSAIRLMMNYASFVISAGIFKTFTRLRPDSVFIFEVSPMTQALPAVKFAKRRKIPCTIYVQDLWPENLEAVAGVKNTRILNAVSRMSDKIYRGCTTILTTSESFKKRLDERTSTKDASGNSKVRFWPQYAEEFYRPVQVAVGASGSNDVSGILTTAVGKSMPEGFPTDDRFKLIFTGNIGYAQGLDILPGLYDELKSRGRECDFVIVGDGRYMDKLREEVSLKGAERCFFFTGRKPAGDIPLWLSCCDAAFVSFTDNELFNMTIPAKLQSYMACHMPILAAAGGETERIIREAGAGYASPVGDVKGLCDNIVKMMDMDPSELKTLGENSGKYAEEHFNKAKLMDEIETMI